MNDEQKIEELQKQIDELSAEMRGYQQRLFSLRQELNRLQNKPSSEPFTTSTTGNATLENFIGLRIIHLVGIVVLVIGLSIGVKYAIDRELISEAARIVLAYMTGLVLYLLSWKLRKKYR